MWQNRRIEKSNGLMCYFSINYTAKLHTHTHTHTHIYIHIYIYIFIYIYANNITYVLNMIFSSKIDDNRQKMVCLSYPVRLFWSHIVLKVEPNSTASLSWTIVISTQAQHAAQTSRVVILPRKTPLLSLVAPEIVVKMTSVVPSGLILGLHPANERRRL